jgi:hypothetical protein
MLDEEFEALLKRHDIHPRFLVIITVTDILSPHCEFAKHNPNHTHLGISVIPRGNLRSTEINAIVNKLAETLETREQVHGIVEGS